jgi:hypothetical protein
MMKLSQKNKTSFLWAMLCVFTLSASAQKTFRYQAVLPKIDSGGFYKIGLQPAFIAKSNAELTDIRLVNGKGNFVPYITADNLPHTGNAKFVVFPEVVSKKDTGTTFIVESKEKAPVNRLWLKLKSTAVQRTINLSGSDDLQRWFAIEEDIPLQQAVLDNDGSYLQSIAFPASNYRYLKLLVNDKNKAPIKFLEAGIFTEQSVASIYFPIANAKFTKTDVNKTTTLTIQLNDNYLVNRLDLIIAAPRYYKRDIAIYQVDKQGRQLIGNAELNSAKKPVLFINAKTNKLQLEIDNGDNSPLDIKDITVAQADQSITAYLDAGKTYRLLTGDVNAPMPTYDLKYFVDSIRNRVPEINHGEVIANGAFGIPTPKAPQRDYTIIIWIVIAVALLLLTLLTLKMTKEVNLKNKTN